jgi:hypothetical protein
MNRSEITVRRLSTQHLASHSAARSPAEVLTSLGAMQAQVYHAALWALALRCRDSPTKSDIEEAIAERKISRTWLMRGTLHFASSQDIHWMLRLFAPRVARFRDRMIDTVVSSDSRLGPSEGVVRKAEDLFAKALGGNRQLTRRGMYKVLERGGIDTSGMLGYHLLYRAAWDGVICFGPHEGKQPTFELLDERIAGRRELSNGRALAELASRYFTSHGPATIKDYVWWSGLKASDARAGVEGASPRLVSEEVDGKTYYMAGRAQGPEEEEGDVAVHLLPAFDEYLVGYSDRSAMLGNEDTQRVLRSGKIQFTNGNGIFLPVIVADGEVVGTWKRRDEKAKVVVTIQPFMKLDKARIDGIREAAGRYGSFLEKPARVEL